MKRIYFDFNEEDNYFTTYTDKENHDKHTKSCLQFPGVPDKLTFGPKDFKNFSYEKFIEQVEEIYKRYNNSCYSLIFETKLLQDVIARRDFIKSVCEEIQTEWKKEVLIQLFKTEHDEHYDMEFKNPDDEYLSRALLEAEKQDYRLLIKYLLLIFTEPTFGDYYSNNYTIIRAVKPFAYSIFFKNE